jgi:hypothetical protein
MNKVVELKIGLKMVINIFSTIVKTKNPNLS